MVVPSPKAVCGAIARLLREARERKGLSMTEVAERAGLSQQMVSYVERGMRIPTIDTMVRISRALEADPADLMRAATSRARENTKRAGVVSDPRR